MKTPGLGFGALGSLLLTANGTAVPLGPAKQRAVLAMLLIRRNRPVSVEALIDAVWDGDPVPAARTSIQSYVSTLRRLLRDAGGNPNTVLASAPPGYQLNVADAECDVGRFLAAKTAGIAAAAAGDCEEASSRLSAALSEWRGPVFDDLSGFSFVDAYATALLEERLAAHTARAEAEIACDRPGAVISELEVLVSRYPHHEPLWAQLITAYYVTERQSDALRAYRRLKTELADGLGIDPGPTVNALHERILRQEPIAGRRTRATPLTTRAQRSAGPKSASLEIAVVSEPVVARLRDEAGRLYRLNGATTRIGRLDDNDIVLDDTEVSRHHAVIADTGTSFVITDLRSTNGVKVQRRRIRPTAVLADGDSIRIGAHEFMFEIRSH
ncbi:DNA-binding transcriptional activator of the SARP family [Mycobacterium rhizamassiliense]|jgi:DNA-binding SARP family transcriptional activator|uniref:DNA-binding transcriptional activator of the SARP family n=1 Tax=Mycobacterium rhizamassiliense TaxID=1841860 RepID=A0A2U3NR84_9MYCO|nr:BTAD domain-containing putative transcriptional regulator [Mycobacterium rhizamassiliense]SPM33953.1 DNA-binding transcriptional activator of the SARP family [Mycobacterium rhizamassiliense]